MFEDHAKDTDRSERSGFIRGLNVDEQIDLVALMWLGRGDNDLESWRDLYAEASRAHNNRTASYPDRNTNAYGLSGGGPVAIRQVV